eukprot:jgi/Botrbrau1/276/Bobra.0022s0245.1
MAPKVGDELPDVVLYKGTPGNEVKIRELFAGKKGVIFAVPGAFTPTCSKTHLPGYIQDYDKLKAAGAEVIVCIAPNDPFVAQAWADANDAAGKVEVLADTQLAFTKAVGEVLDAEGVLGSKRSKRYSAIVVDNVFKAFNAEPDGTGATCSLANKALEDLKALA